MTSSGRAEIHRDHEHQVVRLTHNARYYELLTNAGEAEKYRRGEIKHASDILATNDIWYDHVRAEKPDPMDLAEHFPNQTYDQIIDKILREGEIQVSVGERRHQQKQKREDLIEYIHNHYVDAGTKAPVPINKLSEWFDKIHHKFHVNDSNNSHSSQYDLAEEAVRCILSVGGAAAPKLHLATLVVEIYVSTEEAARIEGEIRHIVGAKILDEKDQVDRYFYTVEISPGESDKLRERIAQVTKGNYGYTLKHVQNIEPTEPLPREQPALKGVLAEDAKFGRKEAHKESELKKINRAVLASAKYSEGAGDTAALMGRGETGGD